MSTSPGTLPRVLRWSRRSALLLALAALAGAGVLAVVPHLGAQDTAVENVAFLVQQPARGRSLPVLPANSVDYIGARYDLAGVAVDVYVVPAATEVPGSDWEAMVCSAQPMQVWAPSAPTRPLSRAPRSAYTLYISGPADEDARCAFAAAFARNFEFFLAELDHSLTEGVPPEFPAVVTLE